ncbi:MAG: HAMP domain-containing histidine kinase [Eubacterium sp.]|nr:HAMP domain-containing histidine kinase [Eubacterium sp.]
MRIRIFWKFVITYVVIAVISFVFISTAGSRMAENSIIRSESRKMYNEGKTIISLLSNRYAGMPFDELTDSFEAVAAFQGSRIMLIATDGRVITDSGKKPAEGEELQISGFDPLALGSEYYSTGSFFGYFPEKMLTVLLPVTGSYEIHGYLAIHVPWPEIISQRESVLAIVHKMAIAIFAIFLLIFIIQHFTVNRPLNRIIKGAQEYAAGNLGYRIEVKSRDEMQYLADTLNYMSEEMNKVGEYRHNFIANISHDFRSPLTSIKGYVEAIADGTIPPEMQNHYLEIVLYQTERLNKLTEELLALNQVDNSVILLNYSRFDINDLIRQAAASFEGACGKKSLVLELLLEEDLPEVKADYSRISQVLHNLIDNAVKFSRPDSIIHIETTKRHDKIQVSVKDHGIGIDNKNLNKIWDRFYKADESRGRDQTGTGLGLAIVKEIINAHNEKITVVSTPGAGTEFVFTLSY